MPAELGNHLLVPIEFDHASRQAKQLALQLALRSSARITLLHVMPEPPLDLPKKDGLDAIGGLHQSTGNFSMSPGYAEILREATLDRLSRELHVEWKHSIDWNTCVRMGDVAEQVLQFARESDVDTIILGGRRRRWFSLRRSNSADRIVRDAPCPVLMVWDSTKPARAPTANMVGRLRRKISRWRRSFQQNGAVKNDVPQFGIDCTTGATRPITSTKAQLPNSFPANESE